MKTNKYKFYIGHNNKTKKREFKKAIRVLNNLNVMGFTLNKDSVGFWDKQQERSFSFEIINTQDNFINDEKARQIKTQLEKDLKQFLVLTEKQQIEVL